MPHRQPTPFSRTLAERAREQALHAEHARAERIAELADRDAHMARLRALRLERERKEAAENPAGAKERAPAKPNVHRVKSIR
jgi:hypothetical protein